MEDRSRCRNTGCLYFENDNCEGYCSVCYQNLAPLPVIPPIIDDDHDEVLSIRDRVNINLPLDAPLAQDFQSQYWATHQIRAVVIGDYINNLEEVRLSSLRLQNVNIPASFDRRFGILSWKWDVSREVLNEEALLDQTSSNLRTAVKHALRIGIEFLLVDVLALPQGPFLDGTHNAPAGIEHGNIPLYEYASLYSRLRVITTWHATEDDVQGRSFFRGLYICLSYPTRAWCLLEASYYLTNPHICLTDLICWEDVQAFNRFNTNPVLHFLSSILFPISAHRSNRFEYGLNRSQLRYPVVSNDLNQPWLSLTGFIFDGFLRDGSCPPTPNQAFLSQFKWSYMMKILSALTHGDIFIRSIVTFKTDLIRMNIGKLFSREMANFIIQLGGEVGREYENFLYFLALQMFFCRQFKYYYFEDIDVTFLSRFSSLLERCVLTVPPPAHFPSRTKIFMFSPEVAFSFGEGEVFMANPPQPTGKVFVEDDIFGKAGTSAEFALVADNLTNDNTTYPAIPERPISIRRIVDILIRFAASCRIDTATVV